MATPTLPGYGGEIGVLFSPWIPVSPSPPSFLFRRRAFVSLRFRRGFNRLRFQNRRCGNHRRCGC